MRFGTKLAIVAAAVLLTLVGFNLIVSRSSLEIIRAGELYGTEIVVTARALPQAGPAHTS